MSVCECGGHPQCPHCHAKTPAEFASSRTPAIRDNRDEWLYLQEEMRRKERQLAKALERTRVLEQAIRTVLADGESQHPGGWGPDVTMLAVLRGALKG